MNYWTQSTQNVYVAAHRGWSEKYPENTMPAFQAAVALDVDQLEFDVHATADGELVIIHDKTVDRTTDGTGAVAEMTFAELRKLDAGSWKGEQFRGLQIPTLIEVMDLVKDHPTMTLDVELKVYPEAGRERSFEVCDRVLKIIDDYGYTDRVVINSWRAELNEYVFTKYGTKYRQHLYFPADLMKEYTIEPYTYGYCACMFGPKSVPGKRGIASKADCDAMRAKGIQPWAGTMVKDEESLEQAIASGVDLITCNNPDLILELLRARGLHK